jgi:hypothetical protein
MPAHEHRALLLLTFLFSLFLVSCSSNHGGGNGGGGDGSNNNLFKGNFVFRLKGFSSSGGLPFGIIGRFTVDGKGTITSGLEDVNIAQLDGSSVAFSEVAFTGAYNMDSSRHGTATLTVKSPAPWSPTPPANPPPMTMNFSFTLSMDGTIGDLIETDGTATPVAYLGSGNFQIKGNNNSGFDVGGSKFVGSYVFSLAGAASVGASAVQKGLIGRFDLVAAVNLGAFAPAEIANTSTSDDQTLPGPTQLGGTENVNDFANDHGVFNIVGGTTRLINFYFVDGQTFYALRMDPNASGSNEAILIGVMRAIAVDGNGQPITFSQTSLKGSYVFSLLGINSNGHASAAVGILSSQSVFGQTSGSVTGIFDSNDGGLVPGKLPTPFGATSGPANFSINSAGRGSISIFVTNSAGTTVTYNFIFYLGSPGFGFLLEQTANDGTNRGRSGPFVQQTAVLPFAASGINGTFIGGTDVATTASANNVAVLALNGGADNSGTFNATEYFESPGMSPTSSPASGTFTVTDQNNGRGTVTAPGVLLDSKDLAFYIVSPAEVVVVGIDSTNFEPQIITLDQ